MAEDSLELVVEAEEAVGKSKKGLVKPLDKYLTRDA